MKKLSVLFVLPLMLFTFVSCEDVAYEKQPIAVEVTVFDNDAVSLLIPSDSSFSSLLENEAFVALIGDSSDYVVLVNNGLVDESYIIKSGDKIAVVENGDGSEENPLLITSADEFKAAASASKSMKLLKDISIPAETHYNTFSGVIDGNGYRLTVENPPMTVTYSDYAEYGLFAYFSGEVKNLKYETNGFKALALYAKGNVVFNNVDTYGDMNGADTNVGPYVVHVLANANLSFVDCNNYANIIDKMGGNHYGAAFVGGYMNSATTAISFKNCNNYGDLYFGLNAAFLIGNSSNINADKITVENCYNYGTILAFGSVGGISWKNSSFDDSATMSEYNKDNGKITKLENSITSFTVAKDGTPTVSGSADPSALKYVLQFNINYKIKETGLSGGNRNMSIEYKLVDGKLPNAIQEITDGSHEHESVVDGVLYIDPYAYEFSSDVYEVSKFPEAITYYVLEPNTENGWYKGSLSCTIK